MLSHVSMMRLVASAALAAAAAATCAPPGGNRTPGVLVYVVGAARTLAAEVDDLARLFCEDAAWAGGRYVVPLLHTWARSSCDGSDIAVPRPFFAAGLSNFTMDDVDGPLQRLVSREPPHSPERTRASAFVGQLFHIYNLNRRADALLRGAGLPEAPGDALVVRWRTDTTVADRGALGVFLTDCARLLPDVPGGVCILPTGKTKLIPPRCLDRRTSPGGVDYETATCCHPEGRGILSDWAFLTTKRVLDAMDGHAAPLQVFAGEDRAEHRLCETLLARGGGRSLVWPRSADAAAAHVGLTSVRCAGATPYTTTPPPKPG